MQNYCLCFSKFSCFKYWRFCEIEIKISKYPFPYPLDIGFLAISTDQLNGFNSHLLLVREICGVASFRNLEEGSCNMPCKGVTMFYYNNLL